MNTLNTSRQSFTHRVISLCCIVSLALLPLQPVLAATSTMEYYHYNHQGSLLEVYNGATNKRLLSQAWSPWGERQVLHSIAPRNNNNLGNLLARGLPVHKGYTGHKELLSTGLTFAGDTRLYDARLKRFLNSDDRTTGGIRGQNRYSYAYNNPMTYTDPDGHTPTISNVRNVKKATALTGAVAIGRLLAHIPTSAIVVKGEVNIPVGIGIGRPVRRTTTRESSTTEIIAASVGGVVGISASIAGATINSIPLTLIGSSLIGSSMYNTLPLMMYDGSLSSSFAYALSYGMSYSMPVAGRPSSGHAALLNLSEDEMMWDEMVYFGLTLRSVSMSSLLVFAADRLLIDGTLSPLSLRNTLSADNQPKPMQAGIAIGLYLSAAYTAAYITGNFVIDHFVRPPVVPEQMVIWNHASALLSSTMFAPRVVNMAREAFGGWNNHHIDVFNLAATGVCLACLNIFLIKDSLAN